MKKNALLVITLACAVFLSACSPKIQKVKQPNITLAPAPAVYQAPGGDEQRKRVETVKLFLPEKTTKQLSAFKTNLSLPPNRHQAETVLNNLLGFSGNEQYNALFADHDIALYSGRAVEVSGKTATVNLNAATLALNTTEMALLCRSITNTLCAPGDIQFVNILVADKQTGTDIAGRMPMGSLMAVKNEEPVWEQLPQEGRFSLNATLYYPALLGKGVLPETRSVAFADNTIEKMTEGLLTALSAEPSGGIQASPFPSLEQLLEKEILVSPAASGGGQIITLRFLQEANDAFINSGIPRSIMAASITLTLCTFLPNIAGVTIYIGEELISALAPTSLASGPIKLSFENGLLKRKDFVPFIASQVPVFYGFGERLKNALVTTPFYESQNIRYIFDILTQDSNQFMLSQGLSRPLPSGLSGADLIGYTIDKDTLLLNFSSNFLDRLKGLSFMQEQIAVYSIVNTMCSVRGIRHVRFFIAGNQPESFSGSLYLPGEFLYNPAIIAD
ncbi:MAG: GerMN domain-containing protein [Eubacteriales bacterium]|nr:GerMN domain-containing protein [Eubacteriales bacterium]